MQWVNRLEAYCQSRWTNALYRCPGYRGETAELADSSGEIVTRWAVMDTMVSGRSGAMGSSELGASIGSRDRAANWASGRAPMALVSFPQRQPERIKSTMLKLKPQAR